MGVDERRPPTADLLTARLFRTTAYTRVEDAISAARDAGLTWGDIEELTGLPMADLQAAHRRARRRARESDPE